MKACSWLFDTLMHIPGLLRDIEINLQPLFPTGMIKLVAATPTPSFLTITDRGDLLFLEGGFIKISGVHHKHVKHTTQAPNYGSILLAQHQDAVYAASFENNNIICYIYRYDLSECHEFCRFRCDYSGTASLAVTNDYLLVMDRTSYTQSVRVYTHDGKHVRSVNLPNPPDGIWPQPGNEIVVKENSYLAKYSITSTNATQIWRAKYPGYSSSNMTVDSSGVIYCCYNDRSRAYLTMYHPKTGQCQSQCRQYCIVLYMHSC